MTTRPTTTKKRTAPGMCLAATRRGAQTTTNRKVNPVPPYSHRQTPGQAQTIEDVEWLLPSASPSEIATRLGTTVVALAKLFHRAGRADLARPFSREAIQDAPHGLVKGAAA